MKFNLMSMTLGIFIVSLISSCGGVSGARPVIPEPRVLPEIDRSKIVMQGELYCAPIDVWRAFDLSLTRLQADRDTYKGMLEAIQ